MITAIGIVSGVFFVISFLVTKENAKYVLSGYNQMASQEQENFDIQAYVSFFKKFHIVLSITLAAFSLFFYYFISSTLSGIFLVLYPLFAYIYFVIKSFGYNKNKGKKEKVALYISIAILVLIIGFISVDFFCSTKENVLLVSKNKISIQGSYVITIDKTDINSVRLVDNLPEIQSKTNGFSLGTIKKGKFKTENKKNIHLIINSIQKDLICIRPKKGDEIYYSSKENSNQEIYQEMKLRGF